MVARVHGVVLVALDGSPVGAAVLPYAEAVARVADTALRLLAVVPPEPRGLTDRSEQLADRLEQEGRERLEQYLSETAASIRTRGLAADAAVVRGQPLDEILAAVEQPDVGLVALSTHGRSGFDRWTMGSVADKVMRLSSKPTLLVRPAYIPVPQRPMVLQSVLVPLDGSALAETALPLAQRMVEHGGKLWLVRVEPWRTEAALVNSVAPRYLSEPDLIAMEEEAEQAAEVYLADLLSRFSLTGRVEAKVLRGRPGPSLVDFAVHEHVGLAVMATHGRGGLRRLVLGSTADYLVRSGVPTLLVRIAGV